MLGQGHTLRLLDEARKVGHDQHPGPENQDSQHMIDEPRGSFPDSILLPYPFTGSDRKAYPHILLSYLVSGVW